MKRRGQHSCTNQSSLSINISYKRLSCKLSPNHTTSFSARYVLLFTHCQDLHVSQLHLVKLGPANEPGSDLNLGQNDIRIQLVLEHTHDGAALVWSLANALFSLQASGIPSVDRFFFLLGQMCRPL